MTRTTTLARALCAAGMLLALAGPAPAQEVTAGPLRIGQPWSRATPKGAKVAGGYLSVTNTGTEPDRLVAASLTQAGRTELHSMTVEGGVMKMAPVEGGLAVKPGETLRLEPGGYHLMFLDLKGPFTKGEAISGSLTFEKAGTVPVSFAVEAIAARAPGGEATGHGAADHGHKH